MSQGDSIVKGKHAVAAHFNVSVRTVQRWFRAADFPRLSGGRFDLHQVQAWRDACQGRPPAPGVIQPWPDKKERGGEGRQGYLAPQRGKDFQDERLKRAQADLKEMEVKKRRRELGEWSELEAAHTSRILACKQGLLTLPRSLPPQLIHCQSEREMEAIIVREVRALLTDFARPIVVEGKMIQGEGALEQEQGNQAEGG